jgi:3-oxoacyl-(acyl-carrier-protein) synthase/3-hydroxymyristoyl/3-hydroxydecanoyl-(acyl carrier protein) dehydratase
VGDKVELSSIRAMLARHDCMDTPLSIGSVKSNIGHLLTAAGAAGIIKTLLAMNRKMLPPSCNFTALPDAHPLENTRVQVQTRADEWIPSRPGDPRRAGVSAFGFGGINAHILVEEHIESRSCSSMPASTSTASSDTPGVSENKPDQFAIVGMQVVTGDFPDLKSFTDRILGRTSFCPASAGRRWRRKDHLPPDQAQRPAGYLNTLSLAMDEFHIPPVQIPDILPQHLVLLQAVKGALTDAGIQHRPEKQDLLRTRAGCAVGIDFDFGAADFSLRWYAHDLDDSLQDPLSPPLTFNRTLGALGGIAASRVAREFKLGGPCFTVSADAASGMKAVEVGTRSLAASETDWFICAGVDMAGDIRSFCLNQAAVPMDPARPAEGAGAIIIKRLADAKKDKDRIYAVIQGVSGGSGGPVTRDHDASEFPCIAPLKQCLADAGVAFSDLSLFHTHSGGHGPLAAAEAHALAHLKQPDDKTACVLGWTAGPAGDTRGISGLVSIIHSALCLYHATIPGFHAGPGFQGLNSQHFVIPDTPIPWPETSPPLRHAMAGAMTRDGGTGFCLLGQPPDPAPLSIQSATGRKPSHAAPDRHILSVPTTRPPIPEDLLNRLNPVPTPSPAPSKSPAADRPAPVYMDLDGLVEASDITARAHEKFLAFSRTNMDHMQTQFAALTRAAAALTRDSGVEPPPGQNHDPQPNAPLPLFTRNQCMEFAVGRAGNVLGPDFDIIDTYPVRVRLPDDPLMLVDRIMAIQGTPCSLGPGKIITQHDVQPDAWYLDGGLAPVSISIEAGQADLFLCAFLGIDHQVKGTRKYRLLDARVTFHRPLPEPGDTIEYHICIDRFLKQGDVFLFFFHYKGYIGRQLFISMRDGCAGFFTEDEVINSGGIVLKKQDQVQVRPDIRFDALVPVQPASFDDDQIRHLRNGNLTAAFGNDFSGMTLGEAQRLPGGPMHLIDRVLSFDPNGGRYGLGTIVAEADIRPDAWFLTCHFIDDPVMPGTLMYECCAHALRIFVQRMGWVSPDPEARFNVLPDNESDLKCRGPVTPATRKARYEIEIKQMGYTEADGQPFVVADAHMFADNLRIVLYKDMGMTLTGVFRDTLRHVWRLK